MNYLQHYNVCIEYNSIVYTFYVLTIKSVIMKSSKLIFGLAVIALGFTSCKDEKKKKQKNS
jgi:hypothetical protein